MAKLAPPDAELLTDEISYVPCRMGDITAVARRFTASWPAFGENLRAPSSLCTFCKGPENKIEPIVGADAVRSLLENILFLPGTLKSVKLVLQCGLGFFSECPFAG